MIAFGPAPVAGGLFIVFAIPGGRESVEAGLHYLGSGAKIRHESSSLIKYAVTFARFFATGLAGDEYRIRKTKTSGACRTFHESWRPLLRADANVCQKQQ